MKSGLLGGFLQLPRQNWYNPFLSSWDRDQENSAFVGQELFRQAYSGPPDLYRPSSEQAKRADPNMTDEGRSGLPKRCSGRTALATWRRMPPFSRVPVPMSLPWSTRSSD